MARCCDFCGKLFPGEPQLTLFDGPTRRDFCGPPCLRAWAQGLAQ